MAKTGFDGPNEKRLLSTSAEDFVQSCKFFWISDLLTKKIV